MATSIITTQRVEKANYDLRGSWHAKAAKWGNDGYVCELSFPLPGFDDELVVNVSIPPGLIPRICQECMQYRTDVSGYGFEEPGTLYLPNGFPLAPSMEIGIELAPILAGVGGVIGGAVGGPGGAALGGAAGALGGSLINMATADSGGSAARPGNLPPIGSQANRARICNFLNITQGEEAASVRNKLVDGASRGWDAGDLNDTRAMLNACPSVGPVDLAQLTSVQSAAPQVQQLPQSVAQVIEQPAQGLSGLIAQAATNPAAAGNVPAALIAGAQALLGQQGAASALSSMYGSNAPQVLDLTRRALRGLDATAAALTADPMALAIVQQARQRQEQHIVDAWHLMDSLTRFMQQG